MILSFDNIPELRDLGEWLKKNKSVYDEVEGLYKGLVQNLLSLNSDIQVDDISHNNSSNLDVSEFLKKLQDSDVPCNFDVDKLFDDNFVTTKAALQNLRTMLENGSKIASSNEDKPKDGDPIWDEVIWGHTQVNEDVTPKTMLHFLVSHYLSQYMNIELGEEFGLGKKDDFIHILGYVLQSEQYKDIYKVWSTSKEEGGLGWLNKK